VALKLAIVGLGPVHTFQSSGAIFFLISRDRGHCVSILAPVLSELVVIELAKMMFSRGQQKQWADRTKL
jgi:hypothetical protein